MSLVSGRSASRSRIRLRILCLRPINARLLSLLIELPEKWSRTGCIFTLDGGRANRLDSVNLVHRRSRLYDHCQHS